MSDQKNFELGIESPYEERDAKYDSNYPHRRSPADQEAANAESDNAAKRAELTLPPVVTEIGVKAVESEAVMVPVTINNAAEIEGAL